MAMTASCRRTQPSLIDRNQPPDTQLWYAPPDSSDYEYKVHLYWRGVDNDGTTTRFIWAIQDTIAAQGLAWNPALRLRDYRLGRVTSRTDSVFSFRAFKDINGVGVRKNRQAFFVASIDDNGVIDPEPAAVEFVATIGELPIIHFTTHINGVSKPYHVTSTPADTVGMYLPFAISYHGTTTNGRLRGYQFFPLSTVIVIPGAGIWTEDLSDTMRTFANTLTDHLPAGTFRFAAQCIDDAGAESPVDGGHFREGVAQIVVNFDPDTWMTDAFFYSSKNPVPAPINFTDNQPDTVPYKAWLYFRYYAHDDPRDTKVCSPPAADPDECIDFKIRLVRDSARLGTSGHEDSGLLPPSTPHDSDANSSTDSNTVNIASFEYDLLAVGIDENGSRDGTPAKLHVIGNYDPSMDSFVMKDHLGNPINTSVIDTLEWNIYKGIGWPYDSEQDTVQSDGVYYKEFGIYFHATGHDDPRDPDKPDSAAVKSWSYPMYTDFQSVSNPGTPVAGPSIGRSSIGWIPGDGNNHVTELAKVRFRYHEGSGDDLLADLPTWANQVITMVVRGRDTKLGEPPFDQIVYWDEVPKGAKAGTGVSSSHLINAVGAEQAGRWTQPKVVQFYLRVSR
jgi:hypothetical protein